MYLSSNIRNRSKYCFETPSIVLTIEGGGLGQGFTFAVLVLFHRQLSYCKFVELYRKKEANFLMESICAQNNRLNTLFMRIDRHPQLQGKRVEAFFQEMTAL